MCNSTGKSAIGNINRDFTTTNTSTEYCNGNLCAISKQNFGINLFDKLTWDKVQHVHRLYDCIVYIRIYEN
jgi:hypothetical protein